MVEFNGRGVTSKYKSMSSYNVYGERAGDYGTGIRLIGLLSTRTPAQRSAFMFHALLFTHVCITSSLSPSAVYVLLALHDGPNVGFREELLLRQVSHFLRGIAAQEG